MNSNTSKRMPAGGDKGSRKMALKHGPVIFQLEEILPDEVRDRKDSTLAELNHIFKMYLRERGTRKKKISILGQFAVLYNDPRFAGWHTMSKPEQSDALSDQVIMPPVFDELIGPIGIAAGDEHTIKAVVKDAVQNAIDSFSHAAFVKKKYVSRFPGLKIILFIDQAQERLVLAVVDNGYGEKVSKPKKNVLGEEYGDDFLSRLVDWAVRRYVEKDEGEVRRDIAYTGGQGMAMKKLNVELQLDTEVRFVASGAVFELTLKNVF